MKKRNYTIPKEDKNSRKLRVSLSKVISTKVKPNSKIYKRKKDKLHFE
jgi:hypothetical protein